MNTREEFEKFIADYENYDFAFISEMNEAWQYQQAKIDALTEENRRLKESQENTVKMLKSVLEMLDRVMHL